MPNVSGRKRYKILCPGGCGQIHIPVGEPIGWAEMKDTDQPTDSDLMVIKNFLMVFHKKDSLGNILKRRDRETWKQNRKRQNRQLFSDS